MTETRMQKVAQNTEKIVAETTAAICNSNTKTEASELLGISQRTLYQRLDDHPEIRAALAKIPKLALNVLQANSLKASHTLVSHLDSEKHALEAAESILDRTGVGKEQSSVNVAVFETKPLLGGLSNDMRINFIEYTPEEVEQIKAAPQERNYGNVTQKSEDG
jgi:hypothetical protein